MEYFLVGIWLLLTLKNVSFYEQTKHLNASHSFTVLTFFLKFLLFTSQSNALLNIILEYLN